MILVRFAPPLQKSGSATAIIGMSAGDYFKSALTLLKSSIATTLSLPLVKMVDTVFIVTAPGSQVSELEITMLSGAQSHVFP